MERFRIVIKKEVDLVILNNASVSLASTIITKGIPIIIKDRKIFINFLLVVTTWAEDRRNFVKEYYEIYQRSKSLSEEDKESLIKILIFLENEMEDFKWAKSIAWLDYQKDKHKRRDIERWIENIMNSILDISKIILSSNKITIPETYREIVISLKILDEFKEIDLEKLSEWVKLRNILAHQYLDIKWEKISDFIINGEMLINNFINKVKEIVSL